MFSMILNFHDRRPENLQRVNAMLSAMPLSRVKARNVGGYLAVKTIFTGKAFRPVDVGYEYGLEELALLCMDEDPEDLHIWQVDVLVFPRGERPDMERVHDLWCDAHPDRVMRELIAQSFDSGDACVVMHHERTSLPLFRCRDAGEGTYRA